jgi:hypothetical protein
VARNIRPLLINQTNVPGNAYYTAAEAQCQKPTSSQRYVCESDALYRNDLAFAFLVKRSIHQS